MPSLDAALQRRTTVVKTQASNSSISQELRQKQIASNERIRKLVIKAAGVFNEIQAIDEQTPVGMGGGVTDFLEGWLEEILYRVEPTDDEG
jgi:serine/threonine-protein kinase 24/25/MST4